jgi:hypothetical protein
MAFTISATGVVNNRPLLLVQKAALFYLHFFINRWLSMKRVKGIEPSFRVKL